MSHQPGLPGFEAAPYNFAPDGLLDPRAKLSGYKLFLALFPGSRDAAMFAAAALRLREQHGLHGNSLRADRLHVTLLAVATFSPHECIPLELIHAATAASSAVSHLPLQMTFDQAGSFSNPTDNNPFVLRCNAQSSSSIAALRGKLQVGLRRFGLHPQPSATPHMTLLYDRQIINFDAIAPIHWTASHFVLVLSHRGLGHHRRLGTWSLK